MHFLKFYTNLISLLWIGYAMEIVPTDIDDLYSKLLISPSKNVEKHYYKQLDKNLKSNVEIIVFYSDILNMLGSVKFAETHQKMIFEKARKTFDQILHAFSFCNEITQFEVCSFWQFWRGLGDLLAEINLLQNEEVKKFVQSRDKIDLIGIDCTKFVEIIKQNNELTNEGKVAQIYLKDIQHLHFSAILFLLHQKSDESVKIGFIGQYKLWEFSKFFDDTFNENETKFAYKLRMLRIKNENKNGKIIIALKVKLKQLIGPLLMTVLEFLRPIELQIEAIVGEYANASEYALFLSDDRQESAKAEIRLSIRIYFGEIWENILKFQCFQIEQRKIEHLWNRGDFMKVIKQIVEIEKKSLETIFEFYHNITGTNDQNREKCFNQNNKSKTKKQISNYNNDSNNDILEVVRKELLEIHTKFMITLNIEENAFSNLLRNSLVEEKGAKAKLQDFYSGKDFYGIEASKEMIWANVLVNMEKKFPALTQMLRDDLTNEQIQQIQIKNYLRFLNRQSETIVWVRAQFLIDILPFYQWFKTQENNEANSLYEKELIEQNLNLMELSMDSMSVKHCEEEIENLKSYIIKLFKYAINCLLPNEHSPIDKHVKILGELLESGEFSKQLKEIYVDEQRINILLGPDESLKIEILSKARSLEEQNSKTMVETSNAHKKPWEAEPDFDEANELIDVYQKMLLATKKISDSVNHSHIVNVAHFQFKLWIKRILQFIDSLKNKNLPKFTRTAIHLGIEATKMGFFSSEQLKNKEENICLMIGFLGHLTGNGTLRENEKWATFIDAFIEETQFLNIIYENVTTAKDKNDWVKPQCSERRISNSVILYLKRARTQEQMHMRVIHVLFLEFPNFLKTVALNGLNFTKMNEFNEIIGENELLNFYKRHLEPDGHKHDSFDANKIAVLLKFLTAIAFRDEQALLDWIEFGQNLLTTSVAPKRQEDVKLMTSKDTINDQLTTTIGDNLVAKAELCAMLKIQEIFAEKFPTARMLCPLLHYIDYLEKTLDNSKQSWQIPFKCFKMEIREINKNQLKVLANEHLSFFISHIEKCAENDELLHILREKRGAMFELRILLGGESNMKNLWGMPKVRSKLHNQNFFANKMRLVEHYKNFLLLDDDAANAADVRLHERFAADVFVWSSWVEADRPRQCLAVQKMLDELFLHFRIFYDAYKITSEVQLAICTLRAAIPALKKLLDVNRNKILSQNEFLKEWGKFTKIVKNHIEETLPNHIEENLPQNDIIKKDKESIDFIQKLHFIEFMKLLNGEYEDGRLQEAFAIILNDLTSNKVHQQKLSAFLTKNDLKQILEKIGIESSIFVEKKEKQNFNIENNEKIVSKKTEKNRRKKEKNKMKIAEKKADIKTKTNTNDSSTKIEQIQGNAKRSEIVEENKETNHFERNESPPKENSNEKMCNNCEENSGKLILQQDIVKYMEKKDQFKHNLSEEFAKIGSFKVFYNNAFLCGKYEEFMTKPCAEMQWTIIDVGAYINEIGHRLKTIDEMEKFAYFENSLNKKRTEQMVNEWQEFMLRIGKTDANEMEQKMNQILLNLLNIENSFELKTQNAKQMQRMKRQIHLKNLSMALLWSSAFGKQWANYENKIIKEKLYYLLGERFGAERFDKVKLEWKNMVQQIELDGELYDKYIPKNEQTNFIGANFPILSQQINLSDDNLETFLEEMIRNNIPEDAKIGQQITEELNEIRSIVEEWSNGIARLYISGSFLLGTRTIGSDIDLLCLAPGKIIKPMHFFDAENIFCKENECSTEATNSLYCQLCKNKNVKSLVKTPFGSVFLIKFEFNEINFDLTFVAIPGRQTLPQLLDDELMAKYISSFKHNKSFDHKRMLRALSSYRSTLYIANLFQENCVSSVNSLLANRGDVVQKKDKLENKKSKSFRIIILFLKIWAINNHIYSTAYGYLNGSTLTIMVAKIMLLYPTASLPFLLEKFFVFYLARPIRVPVQLNKLRLEENLSADENPDPFFVRKPDEQEMPVYMPMFPEQNVAKSVTHCAVRIIRNEMINAFNKINVMNAENLNNLLTSAIPFAEKYETFILVNCVSKQNDRGERFCQFVAGRIRLQIVFDIDLKGNNKTETQLYNGIYQKNCAFHETLSKLSFSFRPNHCNFWLIGIRSDESKETLTNNLNKFDLKIKCDYLKYNYPTTTDNVKELCYGKEPSEIEEQCKKLGIDLKSIIVSREELSDNKITNGH